MSDSTPPDLRSRLLLPGGQPQTPPPDPADPEPAPPTPPASPSGSVLSRLRLPGQAVVPVDYPAMTRTPIPGVAVGGSGILRSPPARQPAVGPVPGPGPVELAPLEDSQAEVAKLKKDNKELKKILAEMKDILKEASENEQRMTDRTAELEAVLVEKTKEVDELHAQMQAIEEQIATGELTTAPAPPPTPKTRTELEEWADELEKENSRLTQERKRIDSDRYQLREDETALEKQMREMEVSMARERAQLARQETELKRLSAEIQHELEMMQGGGTSLREQLARFQRRALDAMQPKSDPKGSSSMNLGQQPPKR